ncbi:MAG: 5'-nucleotidase, partial [Chloroflexota bacterium]|nr:5'-nucleotidase [Chloroflexota bacterium]
KLQAAFPDGKAPIRTALVTARSAPADRRVITTLRAWGVRIDESYYLGGIEKAGIVAVLRPHMMFDDQPMNLTGLRSFAPAALVAQHGEQAELFKDAVVRAPVTPTSLVETKLVAKTAKTRRRQPSAKAVLSQTVEAGGGPQARRQEIIVALSTTSTEAESITPEKLDRGTGADAPATASRPRRLPERRGR